jgi:hypothetical protein
MVLTQKPNGVTGLNIWIFKPQNSIYLLQVSPIQKGIRSKIK